MDTYGIGNAALGTVTGGISSAINYGFQKAAMEDAYYYNELAAKNADKRTRALYNDLYSPEAKLQQFKNAGLSPSLMAATAGGSGISGSTQGAAGGGIAGMQNGVHFSMMEGAQLRAIEAEARLKNAQADEKEGKNAMGQATINNILADTENKQAQEALNKANTTSTEIQNAINSETKQDQIYFIRYKSEEMLHECNKVFWEMQNEHQNFEFNKDTYETRCTKMVNEAAKQAAEIALINAETNLTKDQREKIEAEILRMANQSNIEFLEWETHQKGQSSQEAVNKKLQELYNAQEEQMKGILKEITRDVTTRKWSAAINGACNILHACAEIASVFMGRGASNSGTPIDMGNVGWFSTPNTHYNVTQ